MSPAPYSLTADTGAKATLGLIVLQVDETIEGDFRRLFPDPRTALHVTRIPSGADLTPDTIAAMENELPRATALLPQTPTFDAVGYACTSASTLIGPARVRALITKSCKTRAVCNPLSAALGAFQTRAIHRIGLISPYSANIADPMVQAFEHAGLSVPQRLSFNETIEANVARINPASLTQAARDLARQGGIDGLFMSCTNLRTLDILAPLTAELGLPVLSSNLVLAQAMAAAANLPAPRLSALREKPGSRNAA